MTVSDTSLSLCNLALADIGTRSKITDLPPPNGNGTDTSQEAYFCGLYYSGVVEQLLRAARWNFAKRDEQLYLYKAAPGTPENPTPLPGRAAWNVAYPAPPWLYSYNRPGKSLFVQRILGTSPQTSVTPPLFSGTTNLLTAHPRIPYSKFEIASDPYDASGNPFATSNAAATVTVASPGSDYQVGDVIALVNSQYPYAGGLISQAGWPQSVNLLVTAITSNGGVGAVSIGTSGSYASPVPANPLAQLGSSGFGTGATFNVTAWAIPDVILPGLSAQSVVLTNVQNAVAEYTRNDTVPAEWDAEFATAFYTAMAGKLAQPLTGDKALARDKLTIANAMIINARVADGNEALTINDHTPDWMRIRGIGGGLGLEDYFYAPYGPLFPAAAAF